jgi:hypothetical protein
MGEPPFVSHREFFEHDYLLMLSVHPPVLPMVSGSSTKKPTQQWPKLPVWAKAIAALSVCRECPSHAGNV